MLSLVMLTAMVSASTVPVSTTHTDHVKPANLNGTAPIYFHPDVHGTRRDGSEAVWSHGKGVILTVDTGNI